MKFSCVVRPYASKDGRQFICANANSKYLEEVANFCTIQKDKTYDVKIARKTGVMLPLRPGIYEVECDEIWVDQRPTTKFPTLYLGMDKSAPVFTFKAELHAGKPSAKKAEGEAKVEEKFPF